ncbi:hypothetical protein CALVIDRAFT_217620 [Calocera viscosa TUFC12733]|uniref:Uncharacterized protein n=1 Tax=Calocera viscosa (strain TUFC12733) TaxID=1330018 RepID=A0A167RI16_CALVF|nr:hypothetical protein CALVIDRAFT_217620 [Calocera viscosa TUFC12733]
MERGGDDGGVCWGGGVGDKESRLPVEKQVLLSIWREGITRLRCLVLRAVISLCSDGQRTLPAAGSSSRSPGSGRAHASPAQGLDAPASNRPWSSDELHPSGPQPGRVIRLLPNHQAISHSLAVHTRGFHQHAGVYIPVWNVNWPDSARNRRGKAINSNFPVGSRFPFTRGVWLRAACRVRALETELLWNTGRAQVDDARRFPTLLPLISSGLNPRGGPKFILLPTRAVWGNLIVCAGSFTCPSACSPLFPLALFYGNFYRLCQEIHRDHNHTSPVYFLAKRPVSLRRWAISYRFYPLFSGYWPGPFSENPDLSPAHE